jgi:acetyl-CoA carboxylase biotin carboxyl carrier protein
VPPPTWLDDVRRLLDHVAASDTTELEYAAEGFRIRLTRRTASQAPGVAPVAEVRPVDSDLVQIVAPLTGVFYRASSPGAPPLVAEGDEVQPDSIVGLIETMKIFNEVLAERGGRIATVLVESGQLVHAGDALMTIEDAAEVGGGQAQS